jgi:hypothetical protein
LRRRVSRFQPHFVNRRGARSAIDCIDAHKTLLTKKLYHLSRPEEAWGRALNITPVPHTWSTVEAQGFSIYCKGQVYGALALSRPVRSAKVEPFSAGAAGGLSDYEVDLLRQHASFGCLSLVVRDGTHAYPFVFQKHHVKNVLPVHRLLYCREIGDLKRFAGNVGRFLAHGGGLLVRFDANAPVPGLVGWYSEKRGRKYAKGPKPPLLGDLAFTEAALFDS